MKPTAPQLRYLRILAEQTATTFSPPRTRAEAGREIQRLKTLPPSSRADATRERRHVQANLASAPQDAVRHRRGDTQGYGSSARWAHHSDGAR